MKVVCRNDPGYDKDCEISNARFHYRPLCIYYCESATDVAKVIRDAHNDRVPVRIRAGGHHHEGMCIANDVYLIDLSCINGIDTHEAGRVWIGAGALLKDVYVALWHQGYLFSGGACGDVHVGGLTQGGGWGLTSRKYGLTCDSLIAVEIVFADGNVRTVSQDGSDKDRELLWALRGGGGGNFGVVTKFCFRQHPWDQGYTDLTLTWGDDDLPGGKLDDFVRHWVRTFPGDDDDDLTTYLRLSVVDPPGDDRVGIGGRYVGNLDRAQDKVNRLLKDQPPPRTVDWQPSLARIKPATEPLEPAELEILRRTLGTFPGYQPGPALMEEAAPGAPPKLTETCAGDPIRHKISSGFARQSFDLPAIQTLTSFIRGTRARPGEARQYLSLHSLGGAIARDPEGSAFAFRDRHVLLQYQAWWLPQGIDGTCMAWIANFREAMLPHTDGAFINFVDRDIKLHEYYKQSYLRLIDRKREADPNDFFHFDMSIPLHPTVPG